MGPHTQQNSVAAAAVDQLDVKSRDDVLRVRRREGESPSRGLFGSTSPTNPQYDLRNSRLSYADTNTYMQIYLQPETYRRRYAVRTD